MCFIARSSILSESHSGDEKTESHNCPKVTKLVKDGGIGIQASCLSIRQGGLPRQSREGRGLWLAGPG